MAKSIQASRSSNFCLVSKITTLLLLVSGLQILFRSPLVTVDAFAPIPSLTNRAITFATQYEPPSRSKTRSSNSRPIDSIHHDDVTTNNRLSNVALAQSSDDVEVISPSYDFTIGTVVLAVSLSFLGNWVGGIIFLVFGGFVAFQTTNLRFTFSDSNFSLVKADSTSSGENFVVGGENSWKYDTFVNYDFFPSRSFPILVYFKETQTPKEQWNIGPGELANSSEAISKGAKEGQVHFFPAIANVEELANRFEKYNCAKIEEA